MLQFVLDSVVSPMLDHTLCWMLRTCPCGLKIPCGIKLHVQLSRYVTTVSCDTPALWLSLNVRSAVVASSCGHALAHGRNFMDVM